MKKKLFSLITLSLAAIICFSQFSLLGIFAGAESAEEPLPSYSAYEYLNKYVSDTEKYPDKTEITDFGTSAPWSMKYVNPVDNSEYTTKIAVIRDVSLSGITRALISRIKQTVWALVIKPAI